MPHAEELPALRTAEIFHASFMEFVGIGFAS
jgi:hypothetical protein